jgi:hypothetical protein
MSWTASAEAMALRPEFSTAFSLADRLRKHYD